MSAQLSLAIPPVAPGFLPPARMSLRPYQIEFIDRVVDSFREFDRVLGVAATGAGKTVIASRLMADWVGGCLFLADAQELIRQNADKYHQVTGDNAGVEMAGESAADWDRVVIATTQTMARRLDKYDPDRFGLVIVDEAHRNTLGGMAARVLGHFESAKVLGVTATPFRADRKQLGSFYESIAVEIGLKRLIEEGYLSRITIKSVPLGVDLSDVRTIAGDYQVDELGAAVEPHLIEAAQLLKAHAADRKTVAFLPLIATSQAFVEACRSVGLRAIHCDGTDRDGLRAYERGEYDVISNASLLTTGWDSPKTDCVFILRPTKSLSLYQQMVGRGTRIFPGKTDLLLLDPLFLTDDHSLIKPARLVAKTEAEARELTERLEKTQGGGDLLDEEEAAATERESRLAEELERKRKRNARTVDAMEFCLALHVDYDYEPEMAWERAPVTDKQAACLDRAGFDLDSITCKGHASKILDLLFTRRANNMATPKQVKLLRKWGVVKADAMSFDEASQYIDAKLGGRR